MNCPFTVKTPPPRVVCELCDEVFNLPPNERAVTEMHITLVAELARRHLAERHPERKDDLAFYLAKLTA